RVTSVSTVGLPRESRTSRAWTSMMVVMWAANYPRARGDSTAPARNGPAGAGAWRLGTGAQSLAPSPQPLRFCPKLLNRLAGHFHQLLPIVIGHADRRDGIAEVGGDGMRRDPDRPPGQQREGAGAIGGNHR